MIQYDKLETTKKILNELPESLFKETYVNTPIDQIVFQWWQTGRSGSSLRLTEMGKTAFDYAGISRYDYTSTHDKEQFTSLFISKLSRKMPCPFILNLKNKATQVIVDISVYDSKVAFLISLYGTVYDYINRSMYEEK